MTNATTHTVNNIRSLTLSVFLAPLAAAAQQAKRR